MCDYTAKALIKHVKPHLFVFMGQLLRVRLQRGHVLVLCQVEHLDGAGIRRADFLVVLLVLVCAVFTALRVRIRSATGRGDAGCN